MAGKKRARVLGTDCPACRRLAALVRETAREESLDCDLREVNDLEELTRLGILSVPVLEVNGEIVLSGRVPPKQELRELLGG